MEWSALAAVSVADCRHRSWCCELCSLSTLLHGKLGMLNSFFSKSEFQPLKFGLNSNFVHIFVEKLKQFAFDVFTVGRDEGHSMHARQEAVYRQCNQPGHQAMSRSTAVD